MCFNDRIEENPAWKDSKRDFTDLEDVITKWPRNNCEHISHELMHNMAAQEDEHSDIRHIFPESHISYAIDPVISTEAEDSIAYCEKDKAFFIHLSDVTRYISPKGEFKRFFHRALENKCSIYNSTCVKGMFPEELNIHLLALNSTLWDGSVITIRLRSKAVHGERRIRGVTTHPKSPFFIDIFLARIPPPRRLMYGQADAILQNRAIDQDGNLCTLYKEFCKQFPNRLCKVNGDDTYLTVSNSDLGQKGNPGFRKTRTKTEMRSESASWSLITGMMSQAHEAAGMFNKKRSAGLVKIRQDVPGFHGRIRMITSPMNRAEDLLNHWQIKESLRGNYCAEAEIFMDEHRDEIRQFRKLLRYAKLDKMSQWRHFPYYFDPNW